MLFGFVFAQEWKVDKDLDPKTGKTQIYAELSAKTDDPDFIKGEIGVSCFDMDDPAGEGYISLDFAVATWPETGILLWTFGGKMTPAQVSISKFDERYVALVPTKFLADFYKQLATNNLSLLIVMLTGEGVEHYPLMQFDIGKFKGIADQFKCFDPK